LRAAHTFGSAYERRGTCESFRGFRSRQMTVAPAGGRGAFAHPRGTPPAPVDAAGRDARPYDYVLFTYCWDRGAWGWAALAELQLTSTVDRAGSRAESGRPPRDGRRSADARRPRPDRLSACRPRLGQCLLPWGDDAAHHLGFRLLYIFGAHHTPVTAHTALSTTHGTVPVASRR